MKTIKVIVKETLEKVIEVEYNEALYDKSGAIDILNDMYLTGTNSKLTLEYSEDYKGDYSIQELIGDYETLEKVIIV